MHGLEFYLLTLPVILVALALAAALHLWRSSTRRMPAPGVMPPTDSKRG